MSEYTYNVIYIHDTRKGPGSYEDGDLRMSSKIAKTCGDMSKEGWKLAAQSLIVTGEWWLSAILTFEKVQSNSK